MPSGRNGGSVGRPMKKPMRDWYLAHISRFLQVSTFGIYFGIAFGIWNNDISVESTAHLPFFGMLEDYFTQRLRVSGSMLAAG